MASNTPENRERLKRNEIARFREELAKTRQACNAATSAAGLLDSVSGSLPANDEDGGGARTLALSVQKVASSLLSRVWKIETDIIRLGGDPSSDSTGPLEKKEHV